MLATEDFRPDVQVISNLKAVKLLRDIYLGGKNRNNPHARCPDISRGKGYIQFRLPLKKINGIEHPADGIVDSTVNVEYAKTLIGNKLPPILIGRSLCVIDGGHRYYAAFHGQDSDIDVIMRQDHFSDAQDRNFL